MAYNNGIVVVADEMILGKTDHAPLWGIAWLKGLQIVNGGQNHSLTILYKEKVSPTDLSLVRVPAKIIVRNPTDPSKKRP